MKPKKTDTEPMDEAYKLLDGSPSITAVSDAAKGIVPMTDQEKFDAETDKKNDRLQAGTVVASDDETGKTKTDPTDDGSEKAVEALVEPTDDDEAPVKPVAHKMDAKCSDINDAYSMLFEALAIIARK